MTNPTTLATLLRSLGYTADAPRTTTENAVFVKLPNQNQMAVPVGAWPDVERELGDE